MPHHLAQAIVLSLVASAALAAPAPLPDPGEQEAIAALKKLGAKVVLDGGSARHAINLDLDGTPVRDADMALLRRLLHLRVVSFLDTQVTDAGLIHFRELKRLEVICLGLAGDGSGVSSGRITEAGYKWLEGEMKRGSYIMALELGLSRP
jgi:hypothetical protein